MPVRDAHKITFHPVLEVGQIWQAEDGTTHEVLDLFNRERGAFIVLMVRWAISRPSAVRYRRSTGQEITFIAWINRTNAKLVSRDAMNEPAVGTAPVTQDDD